MADDTNKSKAKYIIKRANRTPYWMIDTTLIENALRRAETVASMECHGRTLHWRLLVGTKHGAL